MHLPCITKLSNSGMHRNPIDMLLECFRQIFFHYENFGFWQCQVEFFVSWLWKDEGSTKNRNRKFRSIKYCTSIIDYDVTAIEFSANVILHNERYPWKGLSSSLWSFNLYIFILLVGCFRDLYVFLHFACLHYIAADGCNSIH